MYRKKAFYQELQLAKKALRNAAYEVSFYHLENAHILGQRHWYRHTLSHCYMLHFGIRTANYKEIKGQILRILAALLITPIWVPKGNTGGSNISATQPLPIRSELQKFF